MDMQQERAAAFKASFEELVKPMSLGRTWIVMARASKEGLEFRNWVFEASTESHDFLKELIIKKMQSETLSISADDLADIYNASDEREANEEGAKFASQLNQLRVVNFISFFDAREDSVELRPFCKSLAEGLSERAELSRAIQFTAEHGYENDNGHESLIGALIAAIEKHELTGSVGARSDMDELTQYRL